MAKFIEADVIQKIATEAEWLTQTRIPYKGQIMIVSDSTGKVTNIKVGDGVNPYSDLSYMFDSIQQNASFVPTIGNTLPTPSVDPAFTILGDGDYGTIPADEGYMRIATWDGSVWTVASTVEMPIQEGSDTLQDEEIPKGKAVKDYVDPILDDISENIDYAFSKKNEFTEELSTGESGVISYEAGIFTGWGEIVGVVQNFSSIRLPKVKYSQSEFPITQIRVTVREGSYTGTILAEAYADFDASLNEEKEVIFDFPTVENPSASPIWVEIKTNGRLPRFNDLNSTGARYSTNTDISVRFSTSSQLVGDGVGYYIQVGNSELVPTASDELKEDIFSGVDFDNNYAVINIPSVVNMVVGVEKDIYFKNIIFSNIPFEKLDINVNGPVGRQFSDKIWFQSSTSAGTHTMTISVSHEGVLLNEKTFSIVVSSGGSSGNRKLLYISDSTAGLDGYVHSPVLDVLVERSLTDGLKVECVGTQGIAPTKHEARGGWRVLDYTTAGRTFYRFEVSGVVNVPDIYSRYTNNGSTFLVMENNVTGGDGYISCERVSGSNLPNASGQLVKTQGNGDDLVNYSEYSVIAGNPFWNNDTGQLDFTNYYSNYGISMSADDYIVIHLGINDIFGATSDEAVDVIISDRINKLNELILSARAAVPNIKIVIAVTIPPASSQDAFGFNYYNGQTLYRYWRNLELWQKAIIQEFDTTVRLTDRIYVLEYNAILDRDNNFPQALYDANARNSVVKITRQTNAVHPAESGYQQMGDTLWSILKVRG